MDGLAPALFVCLTILLLLMTRRGWRTVKREVSQIPSVISRLPQSRAEWWVQFVWMVVNVRFVFLAIQPLCNEGIRKEYAAMPGGLLTAWLLLACLYLPFFIVYVWCESQFESKAHG